MSRVLIIDDDEDFRCTLEKQVQRLEHQTLTAGTCEEGLALAKEHVVDLVLLDLDLPDGYGLDILPNLKRLPYEPEVIVITGVGSYSGAEIALKHGAWDYLKKGSSFKEIILPITRSLQFHAEKHDRNVNSGIDTSGIVGQSHALLSCLESMALCVETDVNVLISGETGTGKELFARAIHNNSPRKHKNFVVVDCASIPEKLLESMLFGHKKGAFTGADSSQTGLVKEADQGTLFLDEIGELPVSMQKSLLRVLQERKFRPVGGDREVESQFRLIAATNRDLKQMVEKGEFRKDLFYRLRTVRIDLPPLRERKEDIESLSEYFLTKIIARNQLAPKIMNPDFIEMLERHHWPGNVRELLHAIEHAVTVSGEQSQLFSMSLPTDIRLSKAKDHFNEKQTSGETSDSTISIPYIDEENFPSIKDFRNNAEKEYLLKLLSFCGNDFNKALSIAQISQSYLYRLLKEHNIERTG